MLINILHQTIKPVTHQVSKLKKDVTTSHTSLIVEVCRRMSGESGTGAARVPGAAATRGSAGMAPATPRLMDGVGGHFGLVLGAW